jgi:hypothetical protein
VAHQKGDLMYVMLVATKAQVFEIFQCSNNTTNNNPSSVTPGTDNLNNVLFNNVPRNQSNINTVADKSCCSWTFLLVVVV